MPFLWIPADCTASFNTTKVINYEILLPYQSVSDIYIYILYIHIYIYILIYIHIYSYIHVNNWYLQHSINVCVNNRLYIYVCIYMYTRISIPPWFLKVEYFAFYFLLSNLYLRTLSSLKNFYWVGGEREIKREKNKGNTNIFKNFWKIYWGAVFCKLA